MKCIRLFLLLLGIAGAVHAQEGPVQQVPQRQPAGNTNSPVIRPDLDSRGGAGNASGANRDSLGLGFERRDDAKDSITISFRYMDSLRSLRLDTSLTDFYPYFSLPARYQFLGNHGSAAYDLAFRPRLQAGFDAGFHAFDIYRLTHADTRFFKTTKPYTTLGYQLAAGKEQMIKVLHTQNPRPWLNVGFDYRLVSAPGYFVTQNNNHNAYRIFSSYQGKRKRYAAYFTLLGNSIKAAENGGMQNDSFLLTPNFERRFTIPVNLGGAPAFQPNPFNASVSTGNLYRDFSVQLRQHYDVGKRDSIIINDSTTEYLFYPRLRFRHTLTYSTQRYEFRDFRADSATYKQWYDTTLNRRVDTLQLIDSWRILHNDFSILQFPDMKNQGQYILAGVRMENMVGQLDTFSRTLSNLVVHGEYHNKTRNRKWDMALSGAIYLSGYNSGDFEARGRLIRFISEQLGALELRADWVNRSPSFLFDRATSFRFRNTGGFNKENTIALEARLEQPKGYLRFANYLVTNYLYFSNYHQTAQYGNVVNLIQVSAMRKFKLYRRWNLYSEVMVQQTDNASPVRVPLVYTRNRVVYENTLFKNLNMAAGLELRYFTPFKGYGYSPVVGQFIPQDTVTLRNLPDIHAYMHFRIKTFTGYLRFENLNAMNFTNGFGFTNNNLAAPLYASPGMVFRFGINWAFVN